METSPVRQHAKINLNSDDALSQKLDHVRFYATVNWYAVYVQPGHEFQIHDYLLGIENETKSIRRGKATLEQLTIPIDPDRVRMECFLPVLREQTRYSDRVVWKERVQTSGMLFVRTRLDRRAALYESPYKGYISGFLSDRVKHQPQPIPDSQMKVFIDVVKANYPVSVAQPTYEIGQRVVILEGPLQGRTAQLVGKQETTSRVAFETDRLGQIVLDSNGQPIPLRKVTLSLRLNSLLSATFEVDAEKVKPAPDDAPDYDTYN